MKTKKLIYCALFGAVISIMSLISIPVQPVPLNMALFAVLLSGGMLGKRYGALSVIVYILLGAVGIPVFAGFRGGLAVLAGPTGGYVLGYIAVAFLTGLVCEKTRKIKYTAPIMVISVMLCYVLGTAWYCYIMKSDVWSALILCVLPFVPADIIKIVLATLVLYKIKSHWY